MANDALLGLYRSDSLRLNTAPTLYQCEPLWSWSVRALPDSDLWCVLKGRGQIAIDGETRKLRPGVCFVLPPRASIEAGHEPDAPLEVFAVHFDLLDGDGLPIDPARLGLPGRGVYLPDLPRLEALVDLVLDEEPGSAARARARELALWQLLLRLAEAHSRPYGHRYDDRVGKALDAIERDLARKWQTDELARIAGLSVSQFARVFSRQMGMPPMRHIARRRVEKAKRLILQTNLSLAEIAERLGYGDPFFFSRQFKRYAGYPPGELRRQRSL